MSRALKEVDASFTKLILFDTLLNTLIVFLVLYLVLSFFTIFAIVALVPATIYFLYVFFRRIGVSNIKKLERAYPRLKEKLAAAADSRFTHNPVAEALHEDVLHDLSGVQESTFFNESRTYVKIGSIVALSFMILLLSPLSFQIPDTNFINSVLEQDDAKEIKVIAGGGSGGKSLDDPNIALSGGVDDIFGERSVAELGESELTLELRPVGHEISIREVRDAPDVDFYETYPTEIRASSSGLYEERIAAEHQKLVKNYFTKLAQEG